MKLLSIDVGIKNLAYCLMETNDDIINDVNSNDTDTDTYSEMPICQYKIVKWDVINLCGKEPNCSLCNKKAKYTTRLQTENNNDFFCVIHAKKSKFKLPEASLAIKKIKKMKLIHLKEIVDEFKIELNTQNSKKEDTLKCILHYLEKEMLTTISSASANNMDMVSIGIAIQKSFDEEFIMHISSIDKIIIENQISPIANRMKTIQGMLAQYFIMHNKRDISFVSSANKLKGYQIETFDSANTSYTERKKAGIKITLDILQTNKDKDQTELDDWLSHFKTHKKKDDLADALLQGEWFIKKMNK